MTVQVTANHRGQFHSVYFPNKATHVSEHPVHPGKIYNNNNRKASIGSRVITQGVDAEKYIILKPRSGVCGVRKDRHPRPLSVNRLECLSNSFACMRMNVRAPSPIACLYILQVATRTLEGKR